MGQDTREIVILDFVGSRRGNKKYISENGVQTGAFPMCQEKKEKNQKK